MGDDIALGIFLLLPLVLAVVTLVFFRRLSERGGRAGWRKVVLGNLLICGLLLSLIAAGGEIYFRFLYDTTDSLAYTKVSQQWMQRYYIENSAGFRDNIEYSRFIEPGKRRITFVGDSFTAGHGIRSVEDRFPNLLRAANTNWEIQVVAKFGLDTGRELELLNRILTNGCQVDRVVLVYCLNDVSDLMPDWQKSLQEFFAKEGQGGWLVRHSFLINTLYHRIKLRFNPEMRKYYEFIGDGYAGGLWQTQKSRLTNLRKLVEDGGGRLLVVTFPFPHALGPDYKFGSVHDQLAGYWREQGVPHLDLLSALSNHTPQEITVGPYDAHPNELANQLAAKAIQSFLTTNLNPSLTR